MVRQSATASWKRSTARAVFGVEGLYYFFDDGIAFSDSETVSPGDVVRSTARSASG
ncbi:hypothetical protein [Oricola sp.]|uniref:hypothetical protein n=1 Tax=Oricola sp. TaxID=1979950 RepID=UPI003BA93F32